MTTRPPQRFGAVSLDLARRHHPRLADEHPAQPTRVDLITQSGGRHPEERARLSESELAHLAAESRDDRRPHGLWLLAAADWWPLVSQALLVVAVMLLLGCLGFVVGFLGSER
jgi:hypothetical protein